MEHTLLKFLNKSKGPIVKLFTNTFGPNNNFFYSYAMLAPQISKNFRNNDVLKFGGSGWSTSREISQEKAITEAVERWAFKYFLDNDQINAAINVDPTTNGFSALPAYLPIKAAYQHAFNESLERYFLSLFADNHLFKLTQANNNCPEIILFNQNYGELYTFFSEALIPYENISSFNLNLKSFFAISFFL